MKALLNIVVVASLAASISFASQGDPFREERIQLKSGRTSAAAKPTCSHDCCRNDRQSKVQNNWLNNLLQTKYGRPVGKPPLVVEKAANTAAPVDGNAAFLEARARAKYGLTPSVEVSDAKPQEARCEQCGQPTCCD